MGVVYEAEQESLGRRVALKVLPAGALTDPKQVRRFEREAPVGGAAASHQHRAGLRRRPARGNAFLRDAVHPGPGPRRGPGRAEAAARRPRGEADAAGPRRPASRPAGQQAAADIARSLVTGRFAAGRAQRRARHRRRHAALDRRRAARAGTRPVALGMASRAAPAIPASRSFPETDRRFAQGVARIGVQVAEALAHAHGQGILHRDIKPSNLLLDREGNVWVADFGLAKAVGTEDLTHTGDIVGTVRYMAPERFHGAGRRPGRHLRAGADAVRAAGAAAGVRRDGPGQPDPPGDAGGPAAAAEAEPARARRPGDDHPQGDRREPGQRYATAKALAEDLKRFLEGRPIRRGGFQDWSGPGGGASGTPGWQGCRRALLVALVSGTIVSSFLAAGPAARRESREDPRPCGRPEPAGR